ncbi:MAG: hypothetical protein HOY69_37485 [Streptomyces sp.]|nr:hypothetical protein [Streptomyces sp.]
MTSPTPARLVDTVHAGAGGATTIDVGVITGDLTIATTDLHNGTAAVDVQYLDADEWYTLQGSPAPLPRTGLAGLHEEVLRAVRAGGGATVGGDGATGEMC